MVVVLVGVIVVMLQLQCIILSHGFGLKTEIFSFGLGLTYFGLQKLLSILLLLCMYII